jgi:hypothetical protein
MSCNCLRSFGFRNLETDIENEVVVNNVKTYEYNVQRIDDHIVSLNVIDVFL